MTINKRKPIKKSTNDYISKEKKNIKQLAIVLGFFLSLCSVSFISYPLLVSSHQDNLPITDEDEIYTPFSYYGGIGQIYDVNTSDGVILKLLRYHPEDQDFRYGSQPILLFSGLLENINMFIMRTTPRMNAYFDIQLPENIESWAINDINIEKDPLLYHSIAYYLWKMGYDVYLGNYRGVGYGDMKSGQGEAFTPLDDFGLYDAPAFINKVYEITGKHAIVGGHSTGGLMTTMYLQGTIYNDEGRIISTQNSVDQRNGIIESPQTVKAFLGLEPAWIPRVYPLMDNILTWQLLDVDTYYDIRTALETIGNINCLNELTIAFIDLVGQLYGTIIGNFMQDIVNINSINYDTTLTFYFLNYVLDSVYSSTLQQYLDWSKYNHVREHFQNSQPSLIVPEVDDSLYYYSDHVDKISVPSLIFLSTHQTELFDLVDADYVVSDIVNGKTPTSIDRLVWIDNSAHCDLPNGLSAPSEVFPVINDWIQDLLIPPQPM